MNQDGKAGMKAAAFMLSAAVWMGSMMPVYAAENTEKEQGDDTKISEEKTAKASEEVGKG